MSFLRLASVGLAVCVASIVGCGGADEPAPVSSRVLDGIASDDTSTTEPVNSSETTLEPDSGNSSTDKEHHYFHKAAQSHAAEWGYDGDSGPEHWGNLSPDYVLAVKGQQQSPIDITGAVSEDLCAIEFEYHPSKIDLVYNGHTVEEIEDKHSSINVEGKRFVLQQFHFHAPSEHTIDGRHASMEMHLVHKSDDGKIAVVGVLIDTGADNPAFDAVWDYLPSADNRERIESATVDAANLLPVDRSYYRYMGSFTTPPCTQDVLWMVLKTPVELSAGQIEKFRSVISGNNRPTQPLNDRTIAVSAE